MTIRKHGSAGDQSVTENDTVPSEVDSSGLRSTAGRSWPADDSPSPEDRRAIIDGEA